jgi:hypothetical protein
MSKQVSEQQNKVSEKLNYGKYYVKRDPATLSFQTDKNGNPVPGEKMRDVRMHEHMAEELNLSWKNLGIIFVPESGAVNGGEENESDDLKDQFPDVFSMKKDDLVKTCEAYGLETEGRVDELKVRLAEYMNQSK